MGRSPRTLGSGESVRNRPGLDIACNPINGAGPVVGGGRNVRIRRHHDVPLQQLRIARPRRHGAARPRVRAEMVVIPAGRKEESAGIAPHHLVQPQRGSGVRTFVREDVAATEPWYDRVDWKEYRRVVQLSTHFLDNVIDANQYPLPEITDLAEMLIRMGASIEGHGTRRIRIQGVPRLHGCTHRVVADRIVPAVIAVMRPAVGLSNSHATTTLPEDQ